MAANGFHAHSICVAKPLSRSPSLLGVVRTQPLERMYLDAPGTGSHLAGEETVNVHLAQPLELGIISFEDHLDMEDALLDGLLDASTSKPLPYWVLLVLWWIEEQFKARFATGS